MLRKSKGFTLIELIIVIVIIGILAAFALPRFANLSTNAKAATNKGTAGSVRSASALAHGASLAQGGASNASISMEGTSVTMANYYPTADNAGIVAAISNLSGISTGTSGSALVFWPDSVGSSANCYVSYTAAAANGAPTISENETDCS